MQCNESIGTTTGSNAGAVHGKEDIKTQFITREGTYKLMTSAEYSRPNRVGYTPQANTPVKVSFVSIPDSTGHGDRICFNVGRELFVYAYKGVKKVIIDRRQPLNGGSIHIKVHQIVDQLWINLVKPD